MSQVFNQAHDQRGSDLLGSLIRPLDELFENQLLLLRAAKRAKQALSALDQPHQVALDVATNSPQRNVFLRNNLDPEVFVSLVIRNHESMMSSIAAINSENEKTKSKKIGEAYDRNRAAFFNDLGEYCDNPEEFSLIETQVTRSILSPSSSALIFQSLYVLAFAHFEHFLSSLTSATLQERDEILGELQEKFSWVQVREPESVSTIKNQLIGKMVNDLLRQSMKKWIEWYSKKNRMKLPQEFADECEQLYELRNLFVHEKSVKAMYMKVANYGLVEKVCNQLAALAVNMCESAVVAGKQQGSLKIFFGRITRLEVRLLDEERLGVVRHMCSRAMSFQELGADGEIHRVNDWIARKRAGDTDGLFEELHAWDAEELGPQFALAKLILSGQAQDAKSEAEDLLARGLLSQDEWDAWPLFDELRQHDFRENSV